MMTALTIAGSDPTGAAGVEADLRVFQALGIHGCAVATALTTQDSERVHDVRILPAAEVGRRLDVLLNDLTPSVVKCGMLGNEEMVEMVVGLIRGPLKGIPLVLDPIILSSSGATLLTPRGLAAMRDQLLDLATFVTPNHLEAIELLGCPQDTSTAAIMAGLSALSADFIVTGGDESEPSAVDYVSIKGKVDTLEADRHGHSSPHGTGCTMSSALAGYIALGEDAWAAVRLAKAFTNKAIQHAERFGKLDGKLFCRF